MDKYPSVDYLRAVINSLEDELVVIDRDFRIIEANEALLKKHGKRREEIVGEYCYDVSHGLPELCCPPRPECPLNKVLETGKPARVTHLHIYDINGEIQERYVDIIVSAITDTDGNVLALTELIRDVTEAKELELKIAEAHQHLAALNAVATVVSQSLDLNTVLSSALDKTLQIMKQGTGSIFLLDENRQEVCHGIHRGLPAQYARGVCYRLGEGVAGKVAQTGEAIIMDDQTGADVAQLDPLITGDIKAFACVPLRSKQKVLGVISIASHEVRRFTTQEVQLLESIAAQIAVAIENAELHQEVERQDESRGELLREMFSIQEEERRRIARELHDDTSQTLASFAASLEAVMGSLPPGDGEVKTRLKSLQSMSIGILDEMHRLIYELRPTLLDDLGLVAATRWLAENNLKSAGVALEFKALGKERRLPHQLETTVFRIVQEAINNTVKHGHSRHASVTLRFKRGAIQATVRDDGRGFDVEEAMMTKGRPRGLGLLGMKERAELFNGVLNIRSQPRGGTEIDVQIPVKSRVSNG